MEHKNLNQNKQNQKQGPAASEESAKHEGMKSYFPPVFSLGRSLKSDATDNEAKVQPGYQSTALQLRQGLRTHPVASGRAIQRAPVKTHFGTFRDVSYTTVKTKKGKEIGVDIYLKFNPGKNVNAKLIGMTQSVRSADKGKTVALNPTVGARSIKKKDAVPLDSPVIGTSEGVHIDQAKYNRNPLYAVEKAPKTDTRLSQGATPSPVAKRTADELKKSAVTGKLYKGWGEHGFRFQDKGKWISKDAELHDAPMLPGRTTDAEQLFETTALAVSGIQEGTYYGSVQWGWRTDSTGKFTKLPLTMKSEGVPSKVFLKAAEIWNKTKTSTGEKSLDLPLPTGVEIYSTPFLDLFDERPIAQLPENTKIRILSQDVVEAHIQILDGPHKGMRGYINTIGGPAFKNVKK